MSASKLTPSSKLTVLTDSQWESKLKARTKRSQKVDPWPPLEDAAPVLIRRLPSSTAPSANQPLDKIRRVMHDVDLDETTIPHEVAPALQVVNVKRETTKRLRDETSDLPAKEMLRRASKAK